VCDPADLVSLNPGNLSPFVYAGATAPGNGGFPVVPKIVRPPDRVLARFSALTNPMLLKIAQNRLQSRILAEMRDALLPRLLIRMK